MFDDLIDKDEEEIEAHCPLCGATVKSFDRAPFKIRDGDCVITDVMTRLKTDTDQVTGLYRIRHVEDTDA